jgi:hypothetical protein
VWWLWHTAPWAKAAPAIRALALEREEKLQVRAPLQYALLSDFLSLHTLKDGQHLENGLYLFNTNLAVFLPRIYDALSAPQSLQFGPKHHRAEFSEANLWVGYGGTISGLHFDDMPNLHHIVEGTKDVLLFPPEDVQKMISHVGIIDVETFTSPDGGVLGPDSGRAVDAQAHRTRQYPTDDVLQPSKLFREATPTRCVAHRYGMFQRIMLRNRKSDHGKVTM